MFHKQDIESLLFAIGEPLEFKKIAKLIGIDKDEVKKIVEELKNDYGAEEKGVKILVGPTSVEMVASPKTPEIIEQFFKNERQENLTDAASETLAIIAYRGPITKVEIEDIRGVNCSFILRNLLIRGLIERETNPKDNMSFIYKISLDFLKHLGLEKIEDLPNFEKFKDINLNLNEENNQPSQQVNEEKLKENDQIEKMF